VRRDELWKLDFQIPLKHGIKQVLGENGGPGGLSHSLRNIPIVLDIARDVERLCPNAWLINYSNPMSAICRAMHKASQVKTFGLCTAANFPRQIARMLGIDDPERVETVVGGLNHWVWLLRLTVDGRDAYPWLRERVHAPDFNPYYRSSVEILDAFGWWPMPGANHVAEFFPYFYGDPADTEARRRYPYQHEHDFDQAAVKQAELRQSLRRQAHGEEPLKAHAPLESASDAVRMLTSIWTGRRTRHFANIANHGLIPNLPHEAVVEVPVIADAMGVRGLQVGPLPQSVVGLVQARCAFFELLADAAIHRSRELALQCLLADTNTTSLQAARACVEEMFAAQAEFLPGFA
ncbi:MAG: hypothetical protein QHJ73_12175, partial [Armatimonadota bacterium]|nr:hypothetical protein [Armatimonadota bacterium]